MIHQANWKDKKVVWPKETRDFSEILTNKKSKMVIILNNYYKSEKNNINWKLSLKMIPIL